MHMGGEGLTSLLTDVRSPRASSGPVWEFFSAKLEFKSILSSPSSKTLMGWYGRLNTLCATDPDTFGTNLDPDPT